MLTKILLVVLVILIIAIIVLFFPWKKGSEKTGRTTGTDGCHEADYDNADH